MDAVRQFQTEMASLYESKPPISKAKMMQITKTGLKGLKYYKHIVQTVEKFIGKCKPEYKVPGLYVIDSLVRQSRHQFGPDKDVFGPRFLKNMTTTFQFLMKCPDGDRPKIAKVLSLWQKSQVFTEDELRPLFETCEGDETKLTTEEIQLHTEFPSSSPNADAEHHSVPSKSAEKQEPEATPSKSGVKSAIDPSLLQQIQKLTNQLLSHQQVPSAPEAKLSKKILSADYEYSDDDSDDQGTGRENLIPQNIASAAKDLLQNTDLIQHIQQIANAHSHTLIKAPGKAPSVLPTPVPPPSVVNTSLPPPGYGSMMPNIPQFNASVPPPSTQQKASAAPVRFKIEAQQSYIAPSVEQLASEFAKARETLSTGRTDDSNSVSSSLDKEDRKRGAAGKHSKRRQSSRSRSRSRDKGKRRRSSSRSRSGRRHRRSRSDSDERRERDRKKMGLPSVKSKHVTICSRTLWLGRVPPYCEPKEIIDALKDYGEPVSVDIISPRGCAYVVMPDRKSAFKVLDRLRDIKIQGRAIKMAWAPGKGVKEGQFKDMWDAEAGASYVPWHLLPLDLTGILDGSYLDRESLPDELKAAYPDPDAPKEVVMVPVLQAPIPVMPPLSAKLQPVPAALQGMQFSLLANRPPPTGGMMLSGGLPFPPPSNMLPPGAGGMSFGGVPVRFASAGPTVAYATPASANQLPQFGGAQLQAGQHQLQQGIRSALARPLFPNPTQHQPMQIIRPLMGMQFATGQPLMQQPQHQLPPQQDFREAARAAGRREFDQRDTTGWRNDHVQAETVTEGRNDDRRRDRVDDRGSSNLGGYRTGRLEDRFDSRRDDNSSSGRGKGGQFEKESRWRDDPHRDDDYKSCGGANRSDDSSSRRDARRSSPERSCRREEGDRPRRSRWGDSSDNADGHKSKEIWSKPESTSFERHQETSQPEAPKETSAEVKSGQVTTACAGNDASAEVAEPEGWD